MSTIKQFEAVAQNIFKQAVKVYTLPDLIKHQNVTQKNLFEKLSQYPGGGVNIRVRRKSWPAGMNMIITEAHYKTSRTGNLFGRTYHFDQQNAREVPMRVRNGNKRSVWEYEIPE